ncbi:MAG: hypothetical protein RSB37_10245 [Acetivibrio sp.]
MKIKKSIVKITAMSLGLLLSVPTFSANAAVTPATPETVQIEQIDYTNGKIELEFNDFVDLKPDFSIIIKDENNNSYTPLNYIKGEDDLDIIVANLPTKQNISVTVAGIKYTDEAQYGNVTGTFKTSTNDIILEKVVADINGQVNVTFQTKVKWRKAKVQVTDQSGKSYLAVLKGKGSKECTIEVASLLDNNNYTFVISGLRTRGSKTYTTVTGTFSIPKKGAVTSSTSTVKIEEIECDVEDGEIDIEFSCDVSWNKPTVVITDSTGKTYLAELRDCDDNECNIRVKGLVENETYTVTISGIKGDKDTEYGTLTSQLTDKSEDDKDDDKDEDED